MGRNYSELEEPTLYAAEVRWVKGSRFMMIHAVFFETTSSFWETKLSDLLQFAFTVLGKMSN